MNYNWPPFPRAEALPILDMKVFGVEVLQKPWILHSLQTHPLECIIGLYKWNYLIATGMVRGPFLSQYPITCSKATHRLHYFAFALQCFTPVDFSSPNPFSH